MLGGERDKGIKGYEGKERSVDGDHLKGSSCKKVAV